MSSRTPLFALALAVCAAVVAIDAQSPTATLTIIHNGTVSGAVGVQSSGPGNQSSGNVCNPNPGGGAGGTCQFTYPVGASLRLMANSPNTPGIFNSGVGDAAACATSVCEFTVTGDSTLTATFNSGGGPYPSLTVGLLGDGKGNVGTDNNQCQNFELGFSACTTYYGAGSSVKIQGRSMPGNIFAGFSGGTVNAAGCGGTAICSFTLLQDSSVDASFSALASVAIAPSTRTITVGSNTSLNASATFTNGMTRLGFGGNTPWQNHTPMDVARFSLAAAVVNDRLYAIGGVDGFCGGGGPCPFSPLGTVEVFNPLVTAIAEFEQAWTPRASMTTPRESLAAAVVSGRIYAIGGHGSGGNAVAAMEAYEPATNTWSARAPMSGPRARMAAAVINDTIYVVGGISSAGGGGASAVATVEAYDAIGNTWTTKAPMQSARNLPAAAAVNGTLYVIGGDGTGSVEAYDAAADTWTTRAPMPNGGGSHRAAALNGLIYAVGGSPVSVKVYNPALNSWLALSSSMPLPVSGEFALAVLDGRLFAAGGNLLSDNTAVRTLSANRPPEATWWSSDNAVGRVNTFNNGSVNGAAVGTATISARLVTIDSGAQSALLTVTSGGGGGGSTIFLGIPSSASTTVGQPNWGCGTFGQNADGPWEVKINYGEGGGNEVTPYSPPPAPCGGGPSTKGWFSFNHAYATPGTFTVTVTVRNIATNASTTQSFPIQVQEDGGGGGDCTPVILNIAKIGTVPFETVHGALFDETNELLGEGEFPFGLFEEFALPEGQFRLELSVPAGYTVTPSSFNIDAVCDQTVNINATVQAIQPLPALTVASSPGSLWPPNNKMRTVSVSVDASSGATIELVSITSNEPGAADDVAGAAFGTDDRTFQLRAKRLGGGNGRVYTITYRATSPGGTTTATTTVIVPHDQGK